MKTPSKITIRFVERPEAYNTVANIVVIIADLEVDGAPLEIAPRSTLQRAVDAWRALGYEPQLGFEMEFFLLQPDPSAPGGFRGQVAEVSVRS